MWTMTNTDGFTQDELDGINDLRDTLMAEYEGDFPEHFTKSLDDTINNAWGAENIETTVRERLGMPT